MMYIGSLGLKMNVRVCCMHVYFRDLNLIKFMQETFGVTICVPG